MTEGMHLAVYMRYRTDVMSHFSNMFLSLPINILQPVMFVAA